MNTPQIYFDHEKLVAKGQFTTDQVRDGKAVLHETVSLLVGLIRSLFSAESE
jgi:hypothetical protein